MILCLQIVEDSSKILKADIYPNPANNQTEINLQNIDNSFNIEISVFNTYGLKVYYNSWFPSVTNLQINLNLQKLVSGNYSILVKNGNYIIKKNLIIIK